MCCVRAPGPALLLAVALTTILGCRPEPDDVGGESGETGDVVGCAPGRFGCPCFDTQPCAEGLECVDGLCELVDDTGETDGAPPSACGWNLAAEWYDCGFQGSDPNGDHPLSCPANLAAETPCPAALSFEGCCDEHGDVWYCEDGEVVHTAC